MCIENVCYAYGFDIVLSERRIESEWIVQLTGKTPILLFLRDKDKFKIAEELALDLKDNMKFEIYANDFTNNTSTLFLAEMNRHKQFSKGSKLIFFKKIYDWFAKDLNIFYPEQPVTHFEYYYDIDSLKKVNQLINIFDTGITDIKIKRISTEELKNKIDEETYQDIMKRIEDALSKENFKSLNFSMRSKSDFFNIAVDKEDIEPKITTLSIAHKESFYEFEFYEESDGTRRVFDLLDILLTENKNSIYVIDEMERSLHPNLTSHFVKLINESCEKRNVQVIFTTHESTIMTQELFRRDQIWFVEKDDSNNSKLYPLDQFNERYDKKINKAYLEGRYGAVPVLKNMEKEDCV